MLAGFCAYGNGYGNHILGGDLSYRNIGANNYKFLLKLYRNCNECEFNTGNCAEVKSLEIFASRADLGYAKKLGSISLSLVSKKDITPMCKSEKSSCNGGSFVYGIEEWVFEGNTDFDAVSKDYCRFEVSSKVESRLDVWAKGEAFYNYAEINTCNGTKNASAIMESPAFHVVAQNQSFTYNPIATDTDGDSLSYALVKAEKAFLTPITYGTNFGPKKPISIYCTSANCDLDNTVWPIDGMDIDPATGWMGFTPLTSGQKGFVVIEISEWRKVSGKTIRVGLTRRDLQIEVVDILNNAPKISSSKLSYFACAGETFNMDLSLGDAAYGGIKDSLGFKAWFDLSGFTIAKVGTAKSNFDAYFAHSFKLSDAREKPYFLTIAATDNHCPQTITTYKTFEITVVPAPDNSFILSHVKCNTIACKANKNEANIQHTWFLYDGSSLEETKTGIQADFNVSKPGKWSVLHQTLNSISGCMVELKDSIVVPSFSLLKQKEEWPNKVCKNESILLKAQFEGGTSPFSYSWNGPMGVANQNYTFSKDSLVQLYIQDANGCDLKITKDIKIFSIFNLKLTDTAMCMPAASTELELSNRYSQNGLKKGSITISYAGFSGSLKNNAGKYTFEPQKPANNAFVIQCLDSNLCKYSKEFHINVIQVVPTGIKSPLSMCSNEKALNIVKSSSCTLVGGVWDCPKLPNAVKSGFFDAAISGAGIYTLQYVKDIGGCLVKDTTLLIVKKAPIVVVEKPIETHYCETNANFYLKGIPGGGTWQNKAKSADNNLFSPSGISKAGYGENTIYYTFTDATNQCFAIDSFKAIVNKAAILTVSTQESVCEGNSVLLNPVVFNATKVDLTGNYAGVNVTRYMDNWIFKTQATGRKMLYNYTVLASALPGCKNIEHKFELIVKPNPTIKLTSTPNFGCSPLNLVLDAGYENNNAIPSSYEWNEGKGWFSNLPQRLLNIVDTGVHKFSVRGSLEGCTGDVKNIEVMVFSTPKAYFDIDPKSQTITQDFPALLVSDRTISSVPYVRFWQFEKGLPSSSSKPSVNVGFSKDTGLYKIKLETTTEKGCTSAFETFIRVRPGLQFWAPNAFTPNEKGPDKNEVFRIVMDSTSTFRITIRNRWGEILFKSSNQFEAWDGTSNNHEVPNGVYFWELEANTLYGRNILRKGVVTIIR